MEQPSAEQHRHADAPAAGRNYRGLAIAAFVLAAAVFTWNQLPKGGYPTDLSRIGQGQAALVLTMNGNFMAGMEMMPVLDTLREEFGGQAHFLVASMGLPEGQAFAQQHQTDQKLAEKDREGYTLVLAMRSWEFEAFTHLRR